MITLDRLINVLGGFGVRLQQPCRVARSTPLRSVVLPESVDGRGVVTGDVLLAVNAQSVDEALDWAAGAGALVVLTRATGDFSTDRSEHLALMTVDPEIAWSELAGVTFGLMLEGRETESGRGPTDLFALADSMADGVGGAVTIEDRLSQLLAYSRLQQHADRARMDTILRRQSSTPLHELFESQGVFAHLARSDEPLFVAGDSAHGLSGRMVTAARAGRELLGSVWVSTPTPLTGPRLAALVTGARTVAVHLLRSRASADLERQVESELVMRLLEGAPDAATIVSKLGLPPGPLRVIAAHGRVGGEPDAALLLLLFERATAGFGWSRPGRSALADSAIYTVLPGQEVASARRWLSSLQAALPENAETWAGISSVVDAAEASIAQAEADECLALHETRSPAGDPPAYDEDWPALVLQRLRTVARARGIPDRGPIAELRRHDDAQSTQYVATLHAWAEAMGDLAQAGATLGVHENTVRNRLRKIAEMVSLDLNDARTRTALLVEFAATDPPQCRNHTI